MKRTLLILSTVILFFGGCTKDIEFEQETTYVITDGKMEKTIDTINGHYYVNLGLPSGLKWATCNVGAASTAEIGDYFAWGETKPKESYTIGNSLTYDKLMEDISGSERYDAATANWGAPWRMPTKDELQELIDECEWIKTTVNGVAGFLVTGPNGNSIFFRLTGYYDGTSFQVATNLQLWTSTPSPDDDTRAYRFDYDSTKPSLKVTLRSFGKVIRPVIE